MRIRNPPKLNLKTILPHRRESEDEDSDAFALKRGGIVIGMRREGAKERIYYVGEDNHLLCIGATRSGKSRCLVVESMPASFRMKRLEHYTALRNGLDMMPLNAPQMDVLSRCDNLLKIADEIYNRHIAPDDNQPDFTELTYRLIDYVYREERMEKLWERLQGENESFREEMLQKSPNEVYEKAYEITIKNDLLMLFEEINISARKIDTLMSFDYPLDAMYREWLDTDASHMDMLRDTVDNLIHEQDKYLQRQDFIIQGETPSEDISIWNAMYDGDNMRFTGNENEADEDLEQ